MILSWEKKMSNKVNKIIYLIPILFITILVIKYGVNVLWVDEWGMVNSLLDGLSLNFFTTHHNEHIIFFPKIIIMICNWISNWNTKVQMLVSIGLISGIYILSTKYINGKKHNCWKLTVINFILGCLIFSPVQYFNFLLGFQIGFNLVAFSAVFAFYYIDKFINYHKISYLYLAIIGAVISSFSSLHGLITWISLIICETIIYIFEEKEKYFKKYLIIQNIITIFIFLLYFDNYIKPSGTPNIGEGGISKIIQGFFIILGGVCGNRDKRINISVGVLLFLIVLITYLKLILHKEIKKNFFGIAISLFGIGCALASTLGRVGFGVNIILAFTERYSQFSILVVLGISMIYLNKDKLLRRVNLLIDIIVIVIGISFLPNWKETYDSRKGVQYVVKNYRECCMNELQTVLTWSDYEMAYDYIYELEKRNLNVFSDDTYVRKDSSITIKGAENIPLPEGTFLGFDNSTIQWDERFLWLIGPWAVDFTYGNTYEKVYIKINNELYLPHKDWIVRQDVADAFQNQKFRYSGFTFSIPIYRLKQGQNKISILVFLRGGTKYYESNIVSFFLDENKISLEMN